MDQTNAQAGQEEAPQTDINKKSTEEHPEERPVTSTGSMEKLLQEEGLNLDFPKQGEIRTGVIASISENEILVSVGTKSEGVIAGKEKEQIPAETSAGFQIGQEIPVYVLNPEDPSGNLILSYNRAREENDWLEAERMKDAGEAFEGKVIGYNKGGLIVPLGMLRGFVPASQVSVLRRVEAEESPDARWSNLVGEPIKVVVIEVDRTRHRLILSERLALQETRETIKERLLDELEEGVVKTGRVTSLADFGAFVNIDGADGLVHLSEISWDRIDHPGEVLKVGQEVKVKVIAVDQERKRIGLSIRQLQPDPWVVRVSNLKEGQLVEGTITHLTKFGAFARLDEDLEGLIHISELSDQRINHPKEVVKEGEVVTLRVIKIDTERRRIGLSIRKVDSMAYANLDYEMMLAGQAESEAKPTEKEPAGEEIPEETPTSETAPTAEAQVEAEAEAAAGSEEPVVEEAALASEEPKVKEAAPASEELAVEEATPASEELAVEEAEPASEEPVVEEAEPASEEPAVEEAVPASEEPAVEEEAPGGEEPTAEAAPAIEEPAKAEEETAGKEASEGEQEAVEETAVAAEEETSVEEPASVEAAKNVETQAEETPSVETASHVEAADVDEGAADEEAPGDKNAAEDSEASSDESVASGEEVSRGAEDEAEEPPEAETAPQAEDKVESD